MVGNKDQKQPPPAFVRSLSGFSMPLRLWYVSHFTFETRYHEDGQITYTHISSGPDAVPKKRGPKTDVLEALLKRVDGLEAKLKEKSAESPTTPSSPETSRESPAVNGSTPPESESDRQPKRPALDTNRATDGNEPALFSPIIER